MSPKTDPEDWYHIGIETGGTSCNVGIIKGTKSLKLKRYKSFKTEDPKSTVMHMC